MALITPAQLLERIQQATAALPELHAFVSRNTPAVERMISSTIMGMSKSKIRTNTMLRTQGRGKSRAYIVIRAQGVIYNKQPSVAYEALSTGGDTGTIRGVSPEYDVVYAISTHAPFWHGKSAKIRYDRYVELMTKLAIPGEVADFRYFLSMPDEIETRAPDDNEPDVTIRHTVTDGTIAEYDRDADRARPKDESIFAVLRKHGFVVVHSLDGIMRYVNSVGLPKSPFDIDVGKWNSLVHRMHRLGLKVAHEGEVVDLGTAAEVRKAALEERAEALGERAERLDADARRLYATATGVEAKRLTEQGIAGYFPTPPAVAVRAVEMLAPEPDEQILEPSAGDGALVRALWAESPETIVDAVEPSSKLQAELKHSGVPLVAMDIREFDPGTWYDGVLMNPPFEDAQAVTHTIRAFEMLQPGGRLVAILPESVWYRTDRAHTTFRSNYLDRYLTDEVELDAQPFGAARSIKTRIVRLDKPASAPIVDGDPDTAARIEHARAAARGHGKRPADQRRLHDGERSLQDLRNEVAGLVRDTRSSYSRADDKLAAGYRRALEALDKAIAAADRAASVTSIAERGGRGSTLELGKSAREVERERQAARREAPKKRTFETEVRAAVRSAVRKIVSDGPVALFPNDYPSIVVADGDDYRWSRLEVHLPRFGNAASVELSLPGGSYGAESRLAKRVLPAGATADDYVRAALDVVYEGAAAGKRITKADWANKKARR